MPSPHISGRNETFCFEEFSPRTPIDGSRKFDLHFVAELFHTEARHLILLAEHVRFIYQTKQVMNRNLIAKQEWRKLAESGTAFDNSSEFS